MTSKKIQTPEYQWEQALVDAYYDYLWHETLEPLYQKFQQWKAGELEHSEISTAIHKTEKQTHAVYSLFLEKRDFLVVAIQANQDWFPAWVKDNPPPPGYPLR